MRIRSAVLIGMLTVAGVSAFLSLFAQPSISGRVTDAASGEGIAGATVSLIPSMQGTSTDSLGYYIVMGGKGVTHIRFNALGYKSVLKAVDTTGELKNNDAALEEDFMALEEVVVAGRGRYRNRGNPAVELINAVIAHKGVNRLTRFDYVSFGVYEKIMMAVSDVPKFLSNSALTRGYRFAFENVDTTLVAGRSLLPVYLEESVASRYQRLHPQATKTIVTANRKTELDQRYVNNENIESYFKFIHTDVDIYANNILILNKPFLSPTADAAPLFYKFFITDTVSNAEGEFVELAFMPRNDADRLFSGKLLIALDGTYGIRRADMRVDQQANLNWVNDVKIALRFGKGRDGIYLPTYSDVRINFGLYQSERGAFGQRTLVFSGYDTNHAVAPGVFEGQQLVKAEGADQRTEAYWARVRPLRLTHAEETTYSNVDSLKHNRSFRQSLKLGYLLAQSYINAGPVEFGPFEYTYSFNDLEGSRFRLSGRTTRQFSEKLYAEGYAAYGVRDNRLKFFGGVAHSLNGRRVGEYPAHYIHAMYQEDARQPGQQISYRNGSSFIGSFRSGEQEKWSYYKAFKFNHVVEFGNHVTLQTFLTSEKQHPASKLHFIRATAFPDTIGALQTTEVGFDLRWAPNEEFFQRNLDRSPIINEYPVFNLRYNMGLRGVLGGEYGFHALRLDISKRVFLSQLGLADINLGGGYIFGTLPFPLLDIPYASKSYALVNDAYALMNPLEFVSDQYVKLNIEYRPHGFILNKIPLLKRLKIRELAGFKMRYGSVRPENRPELNPMTYKLPADEAGNQTTFALGRAPYMEVNAGIENILNVLRVEYVRRLSYLDHPDVDRGGIRFSIKVDF